MTQARQSSTIIRRILKFLGVFVVIIVLLFGIVSWIVFERKNDWLLGQIQSFMNQSQSGQLEIKSINLKLFRNFPDITIELDSINYYEHHDSLRLPGEKPILYVEQLYVALGFWSLINDELKISEIRLSKANLNIVEYENESININLALAAPGKTKTEDLRQPITTKIPSSVPDQHETTFVDTVGKSRSAVQIDLRLISLSDIQVTWLPFAAENSSTLIIKKLETEFIREGKIIQAKLTSIHDVQALYINDSPLPSGDLNLDAFVLYNPDKQYLTIQECKIDYDFFSATLQGTFDQRNNQKVDVQLNALSNNLALLSMIIKPEIVKKNPGLLKQGDLYLKGRVFGELENHPPQFDLSFGVKELSMELPDKIGNFNGIGFEGDFTSGGKKDYSEAGFEIRNIRGQLPGGFVKGHFGLKNFVEPHVNYQLDAQFKLDGYDQVFQIDFLKKLSGNVLLKANFNGPLKFIDKHGADSSRSSVIQLNDLSFVLAKSNQLVSGLSGNIETSNGQTVIRQLTFNYGKNDLQINATIDNFFYFLLNRKSPVNASGNLQSSQLYTNDFILDSLRSAQVQDRVTSLSFGFLAKTSPGNIKGKSGMPNIFFDISNLSATFDKMPDIKLMNASGQFGTTIRGFKLDLHKFQATLPQGKLDVSGELLVPEKRHWEFTARVKTDKFPWNYVMDLVAEIKDDLEPSAKNLPVKKMELVTAELDLSAAIITYPFDINKLKISNSQINFSLPDSKTFSVDGLDLVMENLYFKHPENSGTLTGLKSAKGILALKQLGIPGIKKFDIEMKINGEDDSLDFDFSTAFQGAKSENGTLILDISKKEPDYHLQYVVKDVNLEYFIKKYSKKKLMKGTIDYALDFRTLGSTLPNLKQNLSGEIEISGDSLLLYGIDIDDALKKYKKSQNFNLTDVGAVLIAGPVGLAVTKGTDFVSLASISLDSIHQTKIQTLLAKWKLENRQLITEDVAFATHKNRIAFDGRMDFARDSIPGLTIAVVDKNGCSLMDQTLYGKMGALKHGKLNITETLLGSVINFFNAVVGKNCKPVYTGKVKAP